MRAWTCLASLPTRTADAALHGAWPQHGTKTLIRFLPLALLLAPALAAAQDNDCPQFFPGGTPPAFANPRLAQGTVLLCNDGFAVTASSVTRGALWSAERLTRASVEAALPRPACMAMDATAGRHEDVFTYRIGPGRAGRSHGLKVAALAGLPAPVLARAAELLANYTSPAPSDPEA